MKTKQRLNNIRLDTTKKLSINKLIPNILTIIALCCGLTAIRFAIEGKFEYAVMAVLMAAILDNLDGRIARLIGGTSGFGAQLDSLGDVVSFGVAPAMVMYFWTLDQLGRVGWAAALLFVVCAAVRLARFNLEVDVEKPAFKYNYFTGMPTPAGAALALTPLVIGLQFGHDWVRVPAVIAVWMIFLAGMMISRIPTFSFKKIKIQHADISLMLVGVGVLMAALFAEPWLTLGLIALCYIGSIPLSYQTYTEQEKAWQQQKLENNGAAIQVVAPSPSDQIRA
jgi:CDP-diacylglycerol--serine O-phosphatidyltransferase